MFHFGTTSCIQVNERRKEKKKDCSQPPTIQTIAQFVHFPVSISPDPAVAHQDWLN